MHLKCPSVQIGTAHLVHVSACRKRCLFCWALLSVPSEPHLTRTTLITSWKGSDIVRERECRHSLINVCVHYCYRNGPGVSLGRSTFKSYHIGPPTWASSPRQTLLSHRLPTPPSTPNDSAKRCDIPQSSSLFHRRLGSRAPGPATPVCLTTKLGHESSHALSGRLKTLRDVLFLPPRPTRCFTAA